MAGKIIFVNGASSSGKSTLCAALQQHLDEPFWHFSIDHLRDAGVLPLARIRSGEFSWPALRPAFFDGFHRCLPAIANAGNNLLVEYIVETDAARCQIVNLLRPFDVFFVGAHCPLPELERRERERGDRPLGDARRDFETTHKLVVYDVEVNTTNPLLDNVEAVVSAWKARTRPNALDRMAGPGGQGGVSVCGGT